MRFITTFAFLLLAFQSYSAAGQEEEVKAARQVIAHYKELRKVCAIARGDDRKECFRELTEATDDYQRAKVIVRSVEHNNLEDLHVVTNVQ